MSDHSAYERVDPPETRHSGDRPRARPQRSIRIRTRGRYGATRLTLWVVALIGWLFVLFGILVLVLAVANLAERSSLASDLRENFSGMSVRMLFTVSGLGSILSGFFTIAFAQALRAVIDSADYARQSLVLQKALAEGIADIDTNRMSDRPVHDLGSDY